MLPLQMTILPETMMNRSTMTNSKPKQAKKQHNNLGFRITPRDIDITRTVYEYRALTSLQTQKLFFADNTTGVQCRLRLRHLARNGYLHMQEQLTRLSEGNKPRVYWLDKKGSQLVIEILGITSSELDWRPREWEVGPQFLP